MFVASFTVLVAKWKDLNEALEDYFQGSSIEHFVDALKARKESMQSGKDPSGFIELMYSHGYLEPHPYQADDLKPRRKLLCDENQ